MTASVAREGFAPVDRVGGLISGVELDVEVGVKLGELGERGLAQWFGPEVIERPVVLGLEAGDLVAELAKVVEQASKEVGVAVVPVRAQGVR